jgi:hypothetical protein
MADTIRITTTLIRRTPPQQQRPRLPLVRPRLLRHPLLLLKRAACPPPLLPCMHVRATAAASV